MAIALAVGELATWDWDLRSGEVVWSREHFAMLGYAVGEVAPSFDAWLARVHPEDRSAVVAAVEEARQKRAPYQHEFRVLLPSGEVRQIFARGRFFYDDDGSAVRMVGVMRDVTGERRADAALRESEAKYRSVFASIDEGFCLIEMLPDGNDFRILETNTAFERQTGLVNVVGKRGSDAVPGDDRFWLERYREVARTGEAQRFENYHAATNRWYDVYISRVEGAYQSRLCVVFSDISERKRDDAALRESRQRFQALVTAGNNLIYRMSADWRVMYQLDSNALEVTAEPIENWREKYILEGDRSMVEAAIAEAIRTKSLFELEHRVRLANGAIGWVLSRAVPLFGPAGEITEWFGAGQDVTARREATERLRKTEGRQSFLLQFSDALRACADGQSIKEQAVKMVAEHLGLDRCYISEVFEQQGYSTVGPEQIRAGLRPMTGVYQLADFPETMRQLATQPMVVEDAYNDPRFSDSEKELLKALPQRALLVTPLRKGSRQVIWAFVGAMITPRRWTEIERLLLEDVAERTWTAVERARAEQALVSSEEKFRTLFEMMDEGFALCELLRDREGQAQDYRVLAINPAYERHTGTTAAQLVGRLRSEFDPVRNDETLRRCAQVVATGEPQRFEYFNAGLSRWFDVGLYPRGGDCFAAVFTNITERKRAETALRESEEKYRTLFETMGQGYVLAELVRDHTGRAIDILLLEVNSAYQRLVGIKADEARGRRVYEILPQLDRWWVENYDRIVCAGKPERLEYKEESLNAWYEVWIYPRGQDQLMALFENITERKQAEVALRESAAQLREADRRKNQFLALLGHELRNPLAAIHSGLRLLSSPQVKPESKERALPAVLEQTAHMERLIDDLLEVTRIVEGRIALRKERIAIQDVLRRAVEMCRPKIEAENFQIVIDVPSTPLPLVADGVRLTQVLVNILANALKYSGQSRRVEIAAAHESGEVVVRVRDYGQGIAAELLPRIFDPFVQASPGLTLDAGMGMGLAVVKELVRLHGGSVHAFSAGENQGSEFVVRLPDESHP